MSEPRDLYSEQNLTDINRRLNKRWLVLAVIVVPLLAVFVISFIRRIEWLSMVSASLAGVFAVFWFDLFCMPELRHRNLIRTALTGRNHTEEMELSRVDPDPCMVDGVSCCSLIFLGEPDRHGSRERLFYLDRSLSLPELEPGRTYAVKYTGRTIIGISA